MSPATARATAIGAAMALLVTAGFFACFEQRMVEVPHAASAEARRNPYLALGRLLERMGHAVEVIEQPGSLDGLPPAGGTLLMTGPRHTLRGRRAARLLDWVGEGGHLVTTLQTTWNRAGPDEDPLIDPLGLFGLTELALLGDGEDTDDPGQTDAADGTDPTDPTDPTAPGDPIGEPVPPGGDATPEPADEPSDPATIGAPGSLPPAAEQLAGAVLEAATEGQWDPTVARLDGVELEIAMRPWRQWAEPGDVATWTAEGAHGVHIAQVPFGAGRVTALTDDAFAHNEHIGEHDHAELWVRLLGPPSADAPVWIVTSERWPGLLSQLLRYAQPAVIAGAALLIAALWAAVPRFGPVRPDPVAERRRWIEHLDAVGRFHWRRDRAAALVRGLRDDLERRIRRAHPGWSRLGAEERHARLHEATGLPVEEVAAALDPLHLPSREADAIRTIARIERIRSVL